MKRVRGEHAGQGACEHQGHGFPHHLLFLNDVPGDLLHERGRKRGRFARLLLANPRGPAASIWILRTELTRDGIHG